MLILSTTPGHLENKMASSGSKYSMPSQKSKRTWSDANYGVSESPWRRAADSPSAQLLRELGLQQTASDHEMQLRLDREMCLWEKEHLLSLRMAAEEHERVYQRAKRAQERVRLEFERRRREQEEEEEREYERQKKLQIDQEIAGQERRAAEARNLQERQRAAEEAQRRAEEETREAERRRNEDQERTAKRAEQEEAAIQQAAEEANQRQKQVTRHEDQSQPVVLSTEPPSVPNGVPSAVESQDGSSAMTTSLADREAEHGRYLEIHKQLKHMRKAVLEQCKTNKQLKTQVGDWRREIRKTAGQLTIGENKSVTSGHAHKLREILNAAAAIQQPTLDLAEYLPTVTANTDNNSQNNTQYPAVLFYLLNIFAKALIAQFTNECMVVTKLAEPIGVLAITIFAVLDFQYQHRVSLIDILLAKLHFACPVLFGINGDERTNAGRERLGWQIDQDASELQSKRVWLPEQKHFERMTGLGAGFAALSLRDFSKTATKNPYPSENYWKALARIINTPPHEVSQSQQVVLKALIENHVDRFVKFYGSAAVAALRTAVLGFAAKGPEGSGKNLMKALPMAIEKDFGLRL